jgi:2-amino-4-deoxychorismate synthase
VTDLLSDICAGNRESFAVIARAGKPYLEVFSGKVADYTSLSDIPLPGTPFGPKVLAAVPFRQISERGFDCHDDNTPLRCLLIDEHQDMVAAQVLSILPDCAPSIRHAGFAAPDHVYADTVKRVIESEIGCGAGANFVIRRDYAGVFGGDLRVAALSLLRRLLKQEIGAYWTFAFVTKDFALVGATPERHVSAAGGEVLMNPISGTYRHGESGADADSFLRFLADGKETEELFMVVDEELKMMSAVCDEGGRVLGPYLKRMGHVTHTEYLLQGRSHLDVRQILKQTMFAPTVTGSPVQNAARIIRRYEASGRGYYSGVLALLGSDEHGQTVDAPILIRTCELSAEGTFKISVGATLVRDSDPAGEIAETYAKLAGIRQAMGAGTTHTAGAVPTFLGDVRVNVALSKRNDTLAPFWTRRQPPVRGAAEDVSHDARRVLIVDAEDQWTAMLAHQVRALGMIAEVSPWNRMPTHPHVDVVIAGPGPGDPTDCSTRRINVLRELISNRIDRRLPLVAVCLSHQILAAHLGFQITKLLRSHQGTQLTIDLFGRREAVGFYNSFAAIIGDSAVPGGIEVAADAATGVVHALRGPSFASAQFHAESILTTCGIDILEGLITHALRNPRTMTPPPHLSIDENGMSGPVISG